MLDSNINEKLVLADLCCKLKEQKRQYGKLSDLLQNDENVVDASKQIRSTRLEIYKEMKNLIDLENDFSKNAEDTDMKNIVGVRPKESVDVITIGCKDFKCTQCTFRKQTRGVVESHMYDTHGIDGFECMFCDFTHCLFTFTLCALQQLS